VLQKVEDSLEVQLAMLRQMHQVIEIIKKRVTGYQEIKYNLMPCLVSYLTHDNAEAQRLVAQEIVFLSPFLAESDRAEIVLSKLVDMAHDEKHLQNKLLAAEVNSCGGMMKKMLGSLAPIFGQRLAETYVCAELVSLGIDISEELRVKAL
jgi:hypothetical protein